MHDDTWGLRPGSGEYTLPAFGHAVRPGGSVGWRRPAARIIDTALLVTPVVWVFWALAGPPPGPYVDDYRLMFQILAGIGSALWFVVAWPIYEGLAVAVSGRTFGKWVTGLCVVSADAGRIRVGSLLGRTFLVMGSFVVSLVVALWLWFVYPPLTVGPVVALGLSQAIPALLGERTCLDMATGSDVVRWGRLTGPP